MRKPKIILLPLLLAMFIWCTVPAHASELDQETIDRITEVYGLDKPQTQTNPYLWMNGDFGTSASPEDILYFVTGTLHPIPFMVRNLVYFLHR